MAEQDCARCGAKLADGAAWCSLCYAPVPQPAFAGAETDGNVSGELHGELPDELRDEIEDQLDGAQPEDPGGDVELPFDIPLAPPSGDLLLADAPARLATATPAAAPSSGRSAEVASAPERGEAEISWPCGGCSSLNPMSESVCGACGLPFLAHAKTPPVLNIPGLGDIFQRSRPQQIGFLAASGVVLLAALLGLMAIFSLII